ncbi:hypothetical protein Tco_0690377 [Tanacetum coccineum]
MQCSTEADKALEKMKKLVQALPTLTAPRVGETLTMHLATSKETLEKLVLALVHAARRLRRYFQAHIITVLTNTSIKQILTGPEKIGRVTKWAIELREHDIVFLRREEKEMPTDFLVEIPSEDNEKNKKPKEVPDSSSKWRLCTDGASNSDGSGAGARTRKQSAKQAGINDLRTSHKGSTSQSFDQKWIIARRRKRIQEDQNPGATIQANMRKPVQKILVHAMAPTFPRNSQKETPFSLTYGSEAVIPIIETTDDRGRVQKATKGKESKEVASIEHAYYRNKLRKYHNARSSHPTYIVGDFVLLKHNMNEWQGPYIINEVHKEELYTIVDATDQSLVQTAKGTSLPLRTQKKESDPSPPKTSNMRNTNQVPKGNLL